MIKRVCDSLWKLETLLEARIETEKIHRAFEFNRSQWLKQYVEFNTQTEAEKIGDNDGKALYKLMNHAVCEKTMGKLRLRIDVKLVKRDYLKWTSKLYVTQNI